MNKPLTSDEIREIFLKYFEDHNHLRIQGASLLPDNDPTLLFVNSGMAPLKPYFTGAKKPPQPDLCNVQPCIRTRDIDDVGDRHHLTFFEMLGSWSIGHYFKDGAVELAYGLLVERFGFPKEKIYVSVYSGDPALGLEPDNETALAWERVGIPRDHIVFLGEDNFWGPAGETGPCGPCTEMFFDTGDAHGPRYEPGGDFDTKKRYIEIWNAGVFMQFDKGADGVFRPLPFRSVDTGSGLERLTLMLQNADSVYETDLFAPLMAAIQSQVADKVSPESCRVLADHVRASCFILGEGVTPGNTGRAYIPRRLIRKCVALIKRAGIGAFNYAVLINVVVERFGRHYPFLTRNREPLTAAFLREVQEFERVLDRGLDQLERLCSRPSPFVVAGKDAFDLFSTYGLPVELTREFLKERGGSIDEAGYASEFRRHQEVSRALSESEGDGWTREATLIEGLMKGRSSEFVGYETLECSGTVLAIARHGRAVDEADTGWRVDVLTDRTPFYAEGGGQGGDRGKILASGGAVLKVLDTVRIAGVHVHRSEVIEGALRPGDAVSLTVENDPRRATMANHSATHLLHAALRDLLGAHVRQAGSLVDSERLRFDFEHQQKMTPEQLRDVEQTVNRFIRGNHRRETVVTSYTKAVEDGALAFFGDAYGETVRMVRFGPVSTELCGGTHVTATGDIGMFRIVSESSIASGVRRIIAVTGEGAVRYTQEQDQLLRRLATQLKVSPPELPDQVAHLLKKSASAGVAPGAAQSRIDAKNSAVALPDGVRFVVARSAGTPKDLSDEAVRVADEIAGVAVLVGAADGKVRLTIAVGRDKTQRYNASRLLALLLPYINGKGGGSAHLAQGGGDNTDGVDSLIGEVPKQLTQLATSGQAG